MSRLDIIRDPRLQKAGVELSIVREDLRYPLASGNKWYKLKYALQKAADLGHQTIVSCGGRWSNHLHALAAMGQVNSVKTIGLVRADQHELYTPCLRDARRWGMQIVPITRSDYRQRHQTDLSLYRENFAPHFWIPEGGLSAEGIRGCGDIIRDNADLSAYDDIVCAVGTGTTMVGLGLALSSHQRLVGYQVVKDPGVATFVEHEFAQNKQLIWRLEPPRVGKYAVINQALADFMLQIVTDHQVPLEPVYTAKALYMLFQDIDAGRFLPGQKIAFIHTGGLQGLRGYQDKLEELVGADGWSVINAAVPSL